MDSKQLLKLMLEIDPTTKRVPPGIYKVVNKVIELERERCAKICDQLVKEYGGIAAGPISTHFGKAIHEAMAAGAKSCAAEIRTCSG